MRRIFGCVVMTSVGLIIGLMTAGPVAAGTLTNLTMTPAVTTVGTVTQYTVTFRSPTTAFGPTRALRINNAAGAGGNTVFSGATVQSASGGLLLTVGLAAASEIYVYPSAGSPSVPANTTITIVFNNITNPIVTNGNPYALEVGVLDGAPIDTGTAPANTYSPNPAPFVSAPIPDQTSREEQAGQVVVASDLNDHFDDGDGDVMTFSIQGNTAPSVVTAQVIGNSLRITPHAFGTAQVTVRASDGTDGFADDTFNVQAIGFLSSPTIVPADLIVGRTTQYTLSFTTDTAVSAGDFIILSHAVGGPNQTASTLVSIGPGLTGTKTSGGSTGTVIRVDSGNLAGNSPMTVVLGNIVNPASPGLGPQFLIEKTDGSQVEDRARVLGTTYVTAPDGVFQNGFEDATRATWKAVWPVPGPRQEWLWYDPEGDRFRIGDDIRPAVGTDVPRWMSEPPEE